MKQLTCEMCGSTNLMKQDGVFVCQSCGCKYSVEEAKKMMIEGRVDVSGSTVKVDRTEILKNLYTLARRSGADKNYEQAQNYYEKIALEKPDDWEAYFYKTYYACMHTTIANMGSSCIKLSNILENTFAMIYQSRNTQDKKSLYMEVYAKIVDYTVLISNNIISGAKQYTSGNSFDFIKTHVPGLVILEVKLGDACNMCNLKDQALQIWDASTTYFSTIDNSLKNSIIQRIKSINPDYQPETTSSGGCYVATAVYGSYDCPQVWTLRRFRDNTLAKTWHGRAFIHTYYAISPTLVKWFGHTNWFKKMWRGKLDRMVSNLNANGVENTPYIDKNW